MNVSVMGAVRRVTKCLAEQYPMVKRRTRKEVARSRFELLSAAPEATMIDRYTTGLYASYFLPLLPN